MKLNCFSRRSFLDTSSASIRATYFPFAICRHVFKENASPWFSFLPARTILLSSSCNSRIYSAFSSSEPSSYMINSSSVRLCVRMDSTACRRISLPGGLYTPMMTDTFISVMTQRSPPFSLLPVHKSTTLLAFRFLLHAAKPLRAVLTPLHRIFCASPCLSPLR